jgi:hypothetical protein
MPDDFHLSAKKKIVRLPKKVQISVDPELENHNVLRRYVDLAKYLEFLRSRSLYFCRADGFPDKFEGVLPPGIYASMNNAHVNGHTQYDAKDFLKRVREGMYVNCWSKGAEDNMALWQLYGSASASVAITTTIEKLITCAMTWARSESLEICKVQYVDHFKNPDMVIGRFSDPLRYKHLAYEYENEVRVIISRIGHKGKKPAGIQLPTDPNGLIRSVVVAPEAPTWFYDLVVDATSKYGVTAPVRRSMLTYRPEDWPKRISS